MRGDDDIEHWSTYIGQGAGRFVLSFDVQPANPYFGQIVIVTKSYEIRHRVQEKLEKILREEFVGTDTLVKSLELGPPVGRPIQYRFSGPDIQTLRMLALDFAGVIDVNPNVAAVTYDWNEPSRVLKVDVMQDKARQLGVTSQDIAQALNSIVGGVTVTQVRDQTYLDQRHQPFDGRRARVDRDGAEPANPGRQWPGNSARRSCDAPLRP